MSAGIIFLRIFPVFGAGSILTALRQVKMKMKIVSFVFMSVKNGKNRMNLLLGV